MLHYRDKLICASSLALRSETGPRRFGESAASSCATISTCRFGRESCPQRPLVSGLGG
jgi:hypothetical protein